MEKEGRKKERKRTKENFSIGKATKTGEGNRERVIVVTRKKKAQEMDL